MTILDEKRRLDFGRCVSIIIDCGQREAALNRVSRMCRPEQTVVATEAVPTEKIVKAVPLDQLWLIHGRLYDLRNFVDRHPGGNDANITL